MLFRARELQEDSSADESSQSWQYKPFDEKVFSDSESHTSKSADQGTPKIPPDERAESAEYCGGDGHSRMKSRNKQPELHKRTFIAKKIANEPFAVNDD